MTSPTFRSSQSKGFSTFLIFLIFCLFCASAQAASAVLGIDVGTEYIKATLVKPGIPLDIVLTKDSRRKETSAVCFKPDQNSQIGDFPERVYGSDAVALAARFPGDVYPNLKALLGLPATNSKVQEYAARHPALKLEEEKSRGTAAFRSRAFGADEEPWMVEEILAMEFQSIQKNSEALAGKGFLVKDVVITVPPYFSMEEKRAIELAADLAGLRVLSLLSDGLAVGLNYATTRTFPSITEGGKPEHHLVFDMGAGSTKATVLRFQGRTVKATGSSNKTIQEVQVLGTGWDRTLGGDALNAIIVDDMIDNFVASKGAKAASVTAEAVKAHGRAAAKLWKEAERLRQVLSANTETQASFEGLYDDVDFRYKLSRAGFEKLSESFAGRVSPAIEAAIDKAGLAIDDLDSIILHGGAVRTPFIQRQLEKIAGNSDKIRSNVNADEAAVFGAGFKAAGLSPSFRVKDIKTSEVAGYAIGMKWINVHEKPQHQQLFKPQSLIGVEKTVTFKNQNDFSIAFYQQVGSDENVLPGPAEKEILTLITKNLTAGVAELTGKGCAEDDILAKFGVRLNADHGNVEITHAALHCDLEEEEKKDSVVDSVKGLFGFGAKKDAQEVLDDTEAVEIAGSEPESSTTSLATPTASSALTSASLAAKDGPKMTKRLIVIPLDYDVEIKGYPPLAAKELLRMKGRLTAFDDSDRSRSLREESLNQLEGFTYRIRDLIEDPSFVEASTDAERSSLEDKAKAVGDWLYGDGAGATRDKLRAKLKELKDIVNPIEKRRDEASKRPEQLYSLQQALNQTKGFIDTVRGQIENAASSVSSAELKSSTTTNSQSTATSGDFDGLEDEETSSATASQAATPIPVPPPYTEEDVKPVEELYDSVLAWLTEKLPEQEALPATADPVILVQDLVQRAEKLQKAGMDLVMKTMKIPRQSSSSKSKASKTRTSKKTKQTKGAKPEKEAQKAVPQGSEDIPNKKVVGEDDEMPTKDEILEASRKSKEAERQEKQGHKIDEL
ncbi:MAG: lumenal Hsp70 protein [Claussenomyces sp. TS43310]|nr:MAG: lumenal Hsp70 protein [Claussenomyces sp. TS43310]